MIRSGKFADLKVSGYNCGRGFSCFGRRGVNNRRFYELFEEKLVDLLAKNNSNSKNEVC